MASVTTTLWDPSFEVGDPVLDAQHRHIVDLINALNLAADGEGLQTADLLVDYIGRFMRVHFETEEAVMGRIGFSELPKHAAEHQRLLAEVASNADLVRAGKVTDERFAGVLWSWLHEHTATWDQQYARVLRSRATRG
jgi:hemerythrin